MPPKAAEPGIVMRGRFRGGLGALNTASVKVMTGPAMTLSSIEDKAVNSMRRQHPSRVYTLYR